MKVITNPREAAVDSLYRTETEKRYANLEVDSLLSRSGLSDEDRALYTAIFYGVIERRITLDYIIARISSRPISEIDLRAAAAIRVGLYQLIYMDRVPEFAAVNESVAAATEKTRAFVNAVLRTYLRSPVVLPDKDGSRELSIKYSLPEWLCSMWLKDYPADAVKLMAATFERQNVTLRVNTLKSSAENVIKLLSDGKVNAKISASDGDTVLLTGAAAVSVPPLSTLLENGTVFVQDAASRMCVRALDVHSGMSVYDVCSAPGGKAFSAAIDMNNNGNVLACDIHKNKLSLIESGAQRLGISIIKTKAADARDCTFNGEFDRVLCDVPCSGLGVLAKKPDIRYKSQKDIERLPAIQSAILDASAKAVKAGGMLVYSTCTLRRAENDDIANAFLQNHDDFLPSEFSVGGYTSNDGKLTLMPHITGTDGFFITRFVRVK